MEKHQKAIIEVLCNSWPSRHALCTVNSCGMYSTVESQKQIHAIVLTATSNKAKTKLKILNMKS